MCTKTQFKTAANNVCNSATAIVQRYMTDIEHDRTEFRRMLDTNELNPWIHIARESGTHLIRLYAPDSKDFPAKGQRAPYLFGTSTREEMLRGAAVETFEAITRNFGPNLTVTYYAAGDTDHTELISIDTARAIIRGHVDAVLHVWDAE